MNQQELSKILKEKLTTDKRSVRYDRRLDKLRIENAVSGKGITLSLVDLLNRYHDEGERVIEDCLYYVDHALSAMERSPHLNGKEDKIFPVIRSASFPSETENGKKLVFRRHTAETRIFYAIDLGDSFRLLDQTFLKNEGVSESSVIEMAHFNLRSLPVKPRKDVVRHNAFYFINYNDGYDASRILNQQLIVHMKERARGDLTVAVPHQDVLIFGDIVNPEGYDILAQMTMKFFTEGSVPITALPFIFNEKGELEPIFILAKKRPASGRPFDKKSEHERRKGK
ncbi:DUF1444 family protein [Sporolactobacillus sp. THM7-7]|nr:DUF1444 family protein [Sporolactobacillus sp. THM7-7]